MTVDVDVYDENSEKVIAEYKLKIHDMIFSSHCWPKQTFAVERRSMKLEHLIQQNKPANFEGLIQYNWQESTLYFNVHGQ